MHGILTNATLARVPAGALIQLGRLRACAGVRVRDDGEFVWVRWNDGGTDILPALLPVRGASFFEHADSHWRPCGRSLPAFGIPEDGYQPLAGVLVPGLRRRLPDIDEPAPRLILALKRGTHPRPATALLCSLRSLAGWADTAPSRDIEGLKAAGCESLVLLTGQRLPALPGERFWGERLLCPLGWAPEPALPESALLEIAGVADNELVLLRGGEVEIVPRDAFRDLTRASARLGGA